MIFRIVQEALNNTVKHGDAKVFRITLEKTRKTIELGVEDNGKGFSQEEVALNSHKGYGGSGLASMRERAEYSGGSYSIDSVKGQGTRIRVAWPCRQAKSPPRKKNTSLGGRNHAFFDGEGRQ